MKKIFSVLLVLCVLILSACKGGEDNDTGIQHLWKGENTTVSVDVAGQVITASEFVENLKSNPFLSSQIPEELMSYVELIPQLQFVDVNFKKDNTYLVHSTSNDATKTLSGDYMQANDVVTMIINFNQFDIKGSAVQVDSAPIDFTIESVDNHNIHLSNRSNLIEGSVDLIIDFYGKR